MKKNAVWIIILIIILIIGIVMYRYWQTTKKIRPQITTEKKRNILYWVAPMNPTYRRDKPGKSPMGMDLIPVYEDEKTDKEDPSIVKISPSIENNLGVKTIKVKKMDLPRIISTVGYVTADENYIQHVHVYTEGWIKVLNVKTTGELVHRGQLLLELFSPELVNAQEELLLALKYNNPALISAGEKKLLTLGMSQSQINRLRQTRTVSKTVKIYATRDGFVSQLNVREGKFVKPDTDIMAIEDLSYIWVIAEVFERQADWVDEGQPAIATLPYIPDKTWQGKVDYVYPELNPQTRTLRVRLTFPNPDLTMKPQMYANIKIFSKPLKNVLVIPRSALIRTGEGDRVILSLGDGRYKAQPIKIGIESDDYYQVLSGLSVGDSIVTSAQFLIDSESNLKASFERMQIHPHKENGKSSIRAPQQFVSMGKVLSVNIDKRTISLDHTAIPEINMPAMKMEFDVDKQVSLKGVKPGDNIHFVIVKQSDDTYLITNIHVIEPNKPSH